MHHTMRKFNIEVTRYAWEKFCNSSTIQ